LDRTVARLNIEHYKRLLAGEAGGARRHVLLRLLAEEKVKLAACPPRRQKWQLR
jgi:hypothetical protein